MENTTSSFAEEKKLTQRNNSHTLWKKMQLELDEQVHQYDADTWGAQKNIQDKYIHIPTNMSYWLRSAQK